MKKGLLMIAALVTFSVAANAQTVVDDSKTQTLNVALQDVITLSLDNASVPFTFDDANDYLDGVESDPEGLKVHSNKNFNVSVKANSANLSDGTNNIAIANGVLKVKVVSAPTGGTIAGTYASYTQMPTAATDIITGATKGQDRTFSVQYIVDPGFTNAAGNYSIDIVYTATQQ